MPAVGVQHLITEWAPSVIIDEKHAQPSGDFSLEERSVKVKTQLL